MSLYVECPHCGCPDVKKVGFTWWGGVLGPAILNHVKCEECGSTFNGKTGADNTTGIVIYSVVVGLIAIALVVLFVYLF